MAAAALAKPPQPGVAVSAVGVQGCDGPPRPQPPTAAVGEGLFAEGVSMHDEGVVSRYFKNLNEGVDGSGKEHDDLNSNNDELHRCCYQPPEPFLCKKTNFWEGP